MRISIALIGLCMFVQANVWLLHTSTSPFVCYSWGLVGALVFAGVLLTSVRVRG